MSSWFACAIVVAIPLAMDPGGYFTFLPLKWTFANVLVWAGVAALIAERRPIPRPPAVRAWGAFGAVLVASAVLGVGGLTSWIGYPGRYLGVIAWVTFFAAYVLGSSLSDPRSRARVIRASSVASIAVSAYALLQAAGIDPIAWSENLDVSRARSTLGNAAFLGAYLTIVVPLSGRLALDRSDDQRWRGVHAAAAILGAIALAATQTRGAWLGVVGGIVATSLLDLRRLRARPSAVVGALAACVLVVVLAATVSPLATRIRSIGDTGRGRLLQWERTLDLIGARPVLGWGPDTYSFAFPRYIDAEYERTVRREVVPDRAHNAVLDVASASGVLGAAAYIVVLASITRAVVRRKQRDAMTVALAGACAAYLVQLQFSFPLADLDVIFWLAAGMLVADGGRRARGIHRMWAAVGAVVGVLFAVWGASDVLADRTLRRSLDTEAAGNLLEAQRLVDRAARLAPLRVAYDQAAARLHGRVGEASGRPLDFARGLEAVARARSVMPDDLELAMDEADLLLAWGEVSADPGRIARAARSYEAILTDDPASSRIHLKLGVAYVQLDRTADAEREWLRAATLAPASRAPLENLVRLYEQLSRPKDVERIRTDLRRLDR